MLIYIGNKYIVIPEDSAILIESNVGDFWQACNNVPIFKKMNITSFVFNFAGLLIPQKISSEDALNKFLDMKLNDLFSSKYKNEIKASYIFLAKSLKTSLGSKYFESLLKTNISEKDLKGVEDLDIKLKDILNNYLNPEKLKVKKTAYSNVTKEYVEVWTDSKCLLVEYKLFYSKFYNN